MNADQKTGRDEFEAAYIAAHELALPDTCGIYAKDRRGDYAVPQVAAEYRLWCLARNESEAPSFERMYHAAVEELADVSDALGVPDDEALVYNGPAGLIARIRSLQAGQLSAIPPGYALVPLEPTEAMQEATYVQPDYRSMLQAMIAAAPPPPAVVKQSLTTGPAPPAFAQILFRADRMPPPDADGFFSHPDLECFSTDYDGVTLKDPGDEGIISDKLLSAVGFESRIVEVGDDVPEDHPAYIRYFETGGCGINDWAPTPPEGEGWRHVGSWDTEDGPVAMFVRPRAADPATTKEPLTVARGGLATTEESSGVAPDGLHPRSVDLVQRFASAMAEKLLAAQIKYGYSDGWASPDWLDECRAHLLQHIAKGDPRDVANYCAFLWHHGASTAAPTAEASQAPIPTPDEARKHWGVVVYAGGHDLINLRGDGGYSGLVEIEDYADIVRLAARHLDSFIGRDGDCAGGFWPECSGDPACCPENEGHGCCKPNPPQPGDAPGAWPGLSALAYAIERLRETGSYRDEEGEATGALEDLLAALKSVTAPVSAPADARDAEVEAFLSEVRAELIRARSKFPGDLITTIALAEEFGELCKAVLDESAARVRKEAVQTAVMAARVVLDGDGSVRDWRREKNLDPLVADRAMGAEGGGS